MVPRGRPGLPLLDAAVAGAGCTLVQVQTAADLPPSCAARGMVVVHSQGGSLAGTLDTDAELRRALEPGALPLSTALAVSVRTDPDPCTARGRRYRPAPPHLDADRG